MMIAPRKNVAGQRLVTHCQLIDLKDYQKTERLSNTKLDSVACFSAKWCSMILTCSSSQSLHLQQVSPQAKSKRTTKLAVSW
jgi:hypothetical protein